MQRKRKHAIKAKIYTHTKKNSAISTTNTTRTQKRHSKQRRLVTDTRRGTLIVPMRMHASYKLTPHMRSSHSMLLVVAFLEVMAVVLGFRIARTAKNAMTTSATAPTATPAIKPPLTPLLTPGAEADESPDTAIGLGPLVTAAYRGKVVRVRIDILQR